MTAAARRDRLAGLSEPANDVDPKGMMQNETPSAHVTDATDPVRMSQALIRCKSVTPADDGALAEIEYALKPLGFECHRLVFKEEGTEPVYNLYARLGTGAPHLCFAGHTDVVPPGDLDAWSVDPFAGEIVDGQLIGRGAVDMKGAIGCFIAAVTRLVKTAPPRGSVSLLITGDEEGPAINGTVKVLGLA